MTWRPDTANVSAGSGNTLFNEDEIMLKPEAAVLLAMGILLALWQPAAMAAEDGLPPDVKPLWELGFGAGALYGPDYPSSSERHTRGLALPYIAYRGDILRIGDGQSARAVAFESDRVELDLSFAAAFDADSDDNELRRGMPDLDYMFQLGPQLKLDLAERRFADESLGLLSLHLQARGVFSSDLNSIDHHGYVLEPMLRYRHYGWLDPKLDATISLKPVWATRELHEYFFDVPARFATVQRPLYEARSGYFGTGLNFYASYRFSDKLNAFFGIQTTSHHGSANRDSPLYEKDLSVSFGAGFVLLMFASERMVQVDD